MHARHGKYHPFGNIHRMVGNAFKIFGDDHQVNGIFAVERIFRDLADQLLLDLVKAAVDCVVVPDDLLCQHYIMFYECINTFRDH